MAVKQENSPTLDPKTRTTEGEYPGVSLPKAPQVQDPLVLAQLPFGLGDRAKEVIGNLPGKVKGVVEGRGSSSSESGYSNEAQDAINKALGNRGAQAPANDGLGESAPRSGTKSQTGQNNKATENNPLGGYSQESQDAINRALQQGSQTREHTPEEIRKGREMLEGFQKGDITPLQEAVVAGQRFFSTPEGKAELEKLLLDLGKYSAKDVSAAMSETPLTDKSGKPVDSSTFDPSSKEQRDKLNKDSRRILEIRERIAQDADFAPQEPGLDGESPYPDTGAATAKGKAASVARVDKNATPVGDLVCFRGGREVDVKLAKCGLKTYDGQPVIIAEQATGPLTDLAAAYQKEFGKDIKLTSSFRTMEEQQALYRRWTTTGDGYVTAKPGYSRHQSGMAVDISWKDKSASQRAWLVENAPKFGFSHPLPSSDPVHFEFEGSR